MAYTPPTAIADWQTLSTSKRQSRAKLIPAEWRLPSTVRDRISADSSLNVLSIPRDSGLLAPFEIELTEKYDATELIGLLSSGKVKSYDVTLAFCKRAAIAQQCVNCLTEIMFEEALERAKECDAFLEREGKAMGAFHGLPISLKDSFNVKGTQSTIGYVSFLSRPPSTANSALVDILLGEGAVFYCKTNLPQSMMTADSDNNVFGRTLNPNKLSLTAGGSTGGEGALVKMRGSILGLTTDIGGSTRIPALCCGVKALKPTAGRLPFAGKTPPGRAGTPSSIAPSIGPMAHSVRDLELLMRNAIDSQPWKLDENVLNVPWRRVNPITTPLRFGVIKGHGKRPLYPTIARALSTATSKLEAAGHELISLDGKIPDLWDQTVLILKYFMLDPKRTPVQFIAASGEPFVPSIATAMLPELRDWQPSLDELWDMNVQRAGVLKQYHDLVMGERLDAIIMPGYQATAVPHDTYGLPIYTALLNLLNYPAAILPFLHADKKLDEAFFDESLVYEPPYDADAIEGAPGAVQVVGKPMQDEELLEVLKVVEGILEQAA